MSTDLAVLNLQALVLQPLIRRNPRASRADLIAVMRQAARDHYVIEGEPVDDHTISIAIDDLLGPSED